MSVLLSLGFSSPLSGASRGSSHAGAHVARAPCSGSCRTAGTGPGSRPGTAASSAAPGRTARAAARSGRSGRPGSSSVSRSSSPTSRSSSVDIADAGRYRRSNGASTGSRNGSRQRLHASSSSVCARPDQPEPVLVLVDVELQRRPAPPPGRHRPRCADFARAGTSGRTWLERLTVAGEVQLHDAACALSRKFVRKADLSIIADSRPSARPTASGMNSCS